MRKDPFSPHQLNSYSTLPTSFHSGIPPPQIKRQFPLPIRTRRAEAGLPSDEVKGPRLSGHRHPKHSDSHEGRGAASLRTAALPSSSPQGHRHPARRINRATEPKVPSYLSVQMNKGSHWNLKYFHNQSSIY